MKYDKVLLSQFHLLPEHLQQQVLVYMGSLLANYQNNDLLWQVMRPMKANISVESIKKEQAHKQPNLLEVNRIAEELDIQEPFDELLKQLTP